jgi:hypothetical protein
MEAGYIYVIALQKVGEQFLVHGITDLSLQEKNRNVTKLLGGIVEDDQEGFDSLVKYARIQAGIEIEVSKLKEVFYFEGNGFVAEFFLHMSYEKSEDDSEKFKYSIDSLAHTKRSCLWGLKPFSNQLWDNAERASVYHDYQISLLHLEAFAKGLREAISIEGNLDKLKNQKLAGAIDSKCGILNPHDWLLKQNLNLDELLKKKSIKTI